MHNKFQIFSDLKLDRKGVERGERFIDMIGKKCAAKRPIKADIEAISVELDIV